MFIRLVLASLVVATAATSAVQAAPQTGHDQYQAIDRWVEIFRPWELVGPPVDPQFSKNFKMIAEPDPDPWKGSDPHPEDIGVKQLELGL